jgi:hypothetical protein
MFSDLRNNLKRSGSSLYECSISYSTLKCSFASRVLTTTGGEMPEALSLKSFVREVLHPFARGQTEDMRTCRLTWRELDKEDLYLGKISIA